MEIPMNYATIQETFRFTGWARQSEVFLVKMKNLVKN